MKRALLLVAMASAALAPLSVRAQDANTQKTSTILIKDATLLTVTHGNIEHGSILIRDGKIAAVGTDVKAPDGATVIDASGEYVTPGIIDCHSHIAIDGGVNEGSVSVSSMANIADVLNPDDISIYDDLAGGVTTANVLHGSANPIGGQTVVIKLRWGNRPASCHSRARFLELNLRWEKTRSVRISLRRPAWNLVIQRLVWGWKRQFARLLSKPASTKRNGMTTGRRKPRESRI